MQVRAFPKAYAASNTDADTLYYDLNLLHVRTPVAKYVVLICPIMGLHSIQCIPGKLRSPVSLLSR